MSRRGYITMSTEQVRQHNEKHGFTPVLKTQTLNPPKLREKRKQTKTESEYGLILEAQKRRGEIRSYFYEGITLHWGDGMRYTGDWIVYRHELPVLIIEVKSAHIWDRDLVRFKGCRAEWKDYYDFEMWQRKQGIWSQIL